MKSIFLIAALFTFSLGFSQSETASTASDFGDVEVEMSDLDRFGISVDMSVGEVKFNAPNEIDLINIYDAYGQEIYSAQGTIIEKSKIDLSFLPSGTFYLEVVIGDDMGAHKLVRN